MYVLCTVQCPYIVHDAFLIQTHVPILLLIILFNLNNKTEDREGPIECREGPAEGREGPIECREGPAEGREGPAEGREGPVGG